MHLFSWPRNPLAIITPGKQKAYITGEGGGCDVKVFPVRRKWGWNVFLMGLVGEKKLERKTKILL